MPTTRTKSGKQVLSISITDADRTLIDQHCGPKEIGSFVGRLLRDYDTHARLGDQMFHKRMDRLEQYLVDLLEQEEVTIEI